MNIHIRHPVEYEKIIADHNSRNIELTRHRMAVQQLLDSRDNNTMLISRLKDYIKCFDIVCVTMNPSQKLQKQPYFQWVIDSKSIQSTCWKFEAVVARTALSDLLQKQSQQHMGDHEYIKASKLLKEATEIHAENIKLLKAWAWKLPSANHPILQSKWHISTAHHLQSLQHLCMLCVGLQKESPSKTMYVVAQRATSSAVKSIAFWPSRPTTLKLCQSMQYLFSSHILWNREEYGGSVERLQNWFGRDVVDIFGFTKLQEELDKIPFLLREREQVNNSAYFDPIKASAPLPTLEDLIYMGPIGVPHPQSTRNSLMEPGLGEEHVFE